MKREMTNRLIEVAWFGTVEKVREALDTCSAKERERYVRWMLQHVTRNRSSHALEIVKYLMEQPSSWPKEKEIELYHIALRFAVRNSGPCALDLTKFFMELGAEPDSEILCNAARNPEPNALEMMNLLMEHGAKGDSDALRNALGNCGPYMFDIANLLMEHGATPDSEALCRIAENPDPRAFEMVKLMMERGAQPNSEALCHAARNPAPYALEMSKLMMERGAIPDSEALCHAAGNRGPHALEMVKLMMEKGAEPITKALWHAVENRDSQALEMVKLMLEHPSASSPVTASGLDLHDKNNFYGYTTFALALNSENFAVADYLMSRDDFRLSNLMPRMKHLDFSVPVYKDYRKKAIARVGELVDAKGISYAKTVIADIEKILKNAYPKATKEDAKFLEIIAKKILAKIPKDRVSDAHVTNDVSGMLTER